MLSEFNSLSFMGVSNSEIFFPEKDLNSMEFNFLVAPALDFGDEQACATVDVAPFEEGRDHQKEHKEDEVQPQEQEDREDFTYKLVVSRLKIELPSPREVEDDDGIKTPTSVDHKIPVTLQCPPAPRKPKSFPSTKRKSPCRRALLDLSSEVESLFPPALVADLGNKIKKVRQAKD